MESNPLAQPEGQEDEKSGWVNEPERAQSVAKFVQDTWQETVDGTADKKRYDSITEFHFSGYGGIGDKAIGGVETLYENGAPIQIHAFFGDVKKEGLVDVYLQGRALADYLSDEESTDDATK